MGNKAFFYNANEKLRFRSLRLCLFERERKKETGREVFLEFPELKHVDQRTGGPCPSIRGGAF